MKVIKYCYRIANRNIKKFTKTHEVYKAEQFDILSKQYSEKEMVFLEQKDVNEQIKNGNYLV